MTSRLTKLSVLALPLCLAALPALAFEAGTRWISFTPAHRGEKENVLITYPAEADGDAFRLGADELWTGVPARRNATPVQEKFPLVILSHGSGGNAAGIGWLSTELAKNGFIVAAPNHLRTTSGDSVPAQTLRLTDRAKDIPALIDHLLADPEWSGRIDPARIGGVGFSLGGLTVLLAAGTTLSLDDYRAYCAGMTAPQSDCGWLRQGGVDFDRIDREAFEGSAPEPRLASVVAVDPGFTPAYRTESLRTIAIPSLFVNLGVGDDIPPTLRAEHIAAEVPDAAYAAIPQAVHFTFLGVCNPDGSEVLKRYGEEEPICEDGGDIPREELHKQIFFKIAVFLRRNLMER